MCFSLHTCTYTHTHINTRMNTHSSTHTQQGKKLMEVNTKYSREELVRQKNTQQRKNWQSSIWIQAEKCGCYHIFPLTNIFCILKILSLQTSYTAVSGGAAWLLRVSFRNVYDKMCGELSLFLLQGICPWPTPAPTPTVLSSSSPQPRQTGAYVPRTVCPFSHKLCNYW